MSQYNLRFNFLIILISINGFHCIYVRNTDLMKCSYGERGSLTATCVNATTGFFKLTPYRFDHLDETLRCVNCTLQMLDSGTFDISGNQIKNLDLSNNQINTIRQRAFVGLIFLEQLILTNNDIKSIYPGTFSGVKKITYVNLENNSINILSDDGFTELINLERLNLRTNQIKSIAPGAFNGLGRLNILDLSNNQISDVKAVFNNLTSLQVLYLDFNRISDLKGDDFENLTSLLEISFAHNSIKTIPPLEFVSMTNLRRLDISNNAITNIIAGSFKGLEMLEDLDLSFNNLTEVPQKTLQSLHGLKHLNISHNKLIIFQTGLYSGLPQLRVLNLSQNTIEDIETTGVFSLHSLHTLDISKNNVSDVDYVGLISRLPRISYLNLADNILPCSLEKEMEMYFSQDNFKFILQGDGPFSLLCVDDPKIVKVKETYKNDRLLLERAKTESNGAVISLYVLVIIIGLLVAFLSFVQFKMYREMKAYSIKRTNSEVQLISSDLEARDNDYLKE